ncbi:MAG: response regulator transcription factor [Anaerolineales bacterium]|nr:response regulator transcription factor [Anaerolineales bacterium]
MSRPYNNRMKTILVVDDEPKITQLVRDYLERAGFSVRVVHDGRTALSLARTEKPNMVILDLGLPQLDGLDFTREFRKTSNAPIIMLTARSEESDKLIGLELGADDYMTKPFSPKELVARVRAVFRRMENTASAGTEMIRVADLTLDVPRLRVTIEKREIEELTPTEFELLAALARSPGRVFTRAQLLDAIHGVAFESYERAIDAHIKNIRKKIEVKASEPKYVLTVYGVGYKFVDK